jgi:hypothetical protein
MQRPPQLTGTGVRWMPRLPATSRPTSRARGMWSLLVTSSAWRMRARRRSSTREVKLETVSWAR